MHKFIAIVRSTLFFIIFFGFTVPWLVLAYVAMPLNRRLFLWIAVTWSKSHRFMARWICGQKVVMEGQLPTVPSFYVLKHESMFETMDLPHLLNRPVIAAKKELLEIFGWGRLARAYGLLAVDRDAGASALRQLRAQAQAGIAAGRSLCLFPEGTRVPHGEAPPLKSGFAGLYVILKMPVVPIAVESGAINPRGFLRYPGIIRYRIGETIPAGLPRAEAEARVHAAINALNDLPDNSA
ncbi:1-acyl-sn-glycerol-3-phosphate acyltransferase [Sphingobium sufflavum]|uniref:lysophospholipid acyltransferase family protein n=1 Tax=Sphingobium sufflavum TaxID=1129547 RepID=UPI001F2F7C6A|nr:lysophospholipid acyltransferase family protein [Sphingobium sufflavum]MCE7794961.1 1-acyl-sn-glycerol-3-phosphate acyltransferase [Sphingobium sufflavum]